MSCIDLYSTCEYSIIHYFVAEQLSFEAGILRLRQMNTLVQQLGP